MNRTPRISRHPIATALLAAAVLLGVATAAAAQAKKKGAAAAPPPAPVEAPVPPNLNGMADAAAQAGVRRCLPKIDQVTTFLAANAQSGAMLFAPPKDPDRNLASFSLEVLANDPLRLSYASADFAATPLGCTATYESVTFWENSSCAVVARAVYGGFRVANALRQFISVLDGGPQTKVFLLPAGQHCVSIKKEVLF